MNTNSREAAEVEQLRAKVDHLTHELDATRAEIEKRTRELDEISGIVKTLEIVGQAADDERAHMLVEVMRLRAENERLYNEDTKTRHALKGWVFVCPDGGADPTHERVAAVVAEVERLREERRERIATASKAARLTAVEAEDGR